MRIEPLARAVLALIVSATLVLQPVRAPGTRAADAVIRRVAPGGATTLPCGGGWNPADPSPDLHPCDLQTALTASTPGDEIWTTAGDYLPTLRSDPADPRSTVFHLPDGVALYGGFAGTETTRLQRDWTRYTSHISGDLDGNDLNRPARTWNDLQGANAYHLVQAGNGAVLDGFTISGGDAGGAHVAPCDAACGGALNVNGSTALSNLIITGSRADLYGGGIYIRAGSPTLHAVTIRGCRAERGGGLYAEPGTQPALTLVTLDDNSAVGHGAGAFFDSASASLEDLRVENNTAPNGAGLVMYGGTARINAALFAGNEALGNPGDGSALLLDQTALATVTNATFRRNRANFGTLAALHSNARLVLTHGTIVENAAYGPLGGGVLHAGDGASFTVYDSIFYDTGKIFSGSGYSSAVFDHSSLQSCPAGATCPNLLQSEQIRAALGMYKTFATTAGYPLRIISQVIGLAGCVDYVPDGAGGVRTAPLTRDQRGMPRPFGSACDLGALEFAPRTLYVDDSADGANTGLTWLDAFTDLQEALTATANGDQVWVTAGTYYPTSDPLDRAASFELREEVAVYGGFAGNESALDQRDFHTNETILSGDIDHGQPVASGHSYHVVYSYSFGSPYIGNECVLDGFTISGGRADGPLAPDGSAVNRQGGGLHIRSGQPTLRNLVIRDNYGEQGGGMFTDSNVQVQNVLFLNNDAVYGGGLASGQGPLPNFSQSQPIMVNVTFAGNTADFGGAIANRSAYPLYLYPDIIIRPNLYHTTLKDNIARVAGSAIYATDSHTALANSIVWGGDPASIFAGDATSRFIFFDSIVAGGCPAGEDCTNVSGADPLLGALGSAGDGPVTFPLGPNSPAIDAGAAPYCTRIYFTGTFTYERTPLTFDQRGAPRPAGGGCDLGAHEFQAALSILSGDEQRSDPFTTFSYPLVVGASSAWGDSVEGLVVHYTPLETGGTSYLSNYAPVIHNGQAAVTATASIGEFRVDGSGPGLNTVSFTLYVNDTTVALAASPNPALAGQLVTLTATVTGYTFGIPPTPTGTVTFKDGADVLGTVTLPAAHLTGDPFAVAQLTVSNLVPGTHALSAVYTPASTSPDPIWIQPYHDITTSPTQNLTVTGSTVAVVTLSDLQQTYTGTPRAVTVTTNPPGLPVTVTYNGSTQPPVKAGNYTVLAEVNHPIYTGQDSGTLVNSKARIKIQAEPASRPYGAPNPTFGYSLTGFVDGEDASVVHNQPTLTCDAGQDSDVGSYTIQVEPGALEAENYEFDPWNNQLSVKKALTTTRLALSPGLLTAGQPVTITGLVARALPGGPFPTGSLAIRKDNATVSTLALVDGVARLVLTGLPVGSHTFTADYLPDGNHTASQAQITLTIGATVQLFFPWISR